MTCITVRVVTVAETVRCACANYSYHLFGGQKKGLGDNEQRGSLITRLPCLARVLSCCYCYYTEALSPPTDINARTFCVYYYYYNYYLLPLLAITK